MKNKEILKKIDAFFLLDRPGKMQPLDGIRGLAVVMVFMVHFASYSSSYYGSPGHLSSISKLINNVLNYFPFLGSSGGHFGVDIFFILSGFLIYATIKKNVPSFKTFMLHRYKRLLPAHFFVLLHTLTVTPVFGIIVNIFFLTYFFPKVQPINFVTWTLSYEFLFYLICAVWLILGRSIKFLQTWSSTFLLIVLIILSPHLLAPLFSKVDMKYIEVNRFIAFFFGLVLSKLYIDNKKLWLSVEKFFVYGVIPSIIGMCLIRYFWSNSFFSLFRSYNETVQYIFFDITAFMIIGSLLSTGNGQLKRVFSSRPLRILGVVSYSFYLNHALWGLSIGARLVDFLGGGASKVVVYLVLSFAVTFFISVLMFHYLEKPYFKKSK